MKDPRVPRGPLRPTSPAADQDSSDLVDLKAIAASTRAGATPPPVVTAAELSGVVARRDSVVGMRVSGRGAAAAIPPWIFGALGCLGVMAVGLGIFWYLSSSPGGRAAVASTARHLAGTPSSLPSSSPSSSLPSSSGPEIVPLPARPHEPPAPVEVARPEKPVRRWGGGRAHPEIAAAPEAAEAPAAEAPAAEAPAARKSNALDDVLAAAMNRREPAPGKTTAGGASSPAAAPSAGDPDKTVKDVDAALEDLQPKVRQCFRRFQIRGVAAVNLTVAPTGTIQSSALTGDFEGTPTGDCVIKELASAALPPFRGAPLKVSHQFVFR